MAAKLRVMTYNVHSCIGSDLRLNPERVLRIIEQWAPDIVALQELDIGQSRTRGLDQPEFFAKSMAMELHFVPARGNGASGRRRTTGRCRPSGRGGSRTGPSPTGRFHMPRMCIR